jgi:glyoxylase-like metal-dependent hydrolase (beta-lactamase superfamily II)
VGADTENPTMEKAFLVVGALLLPLVAAASAMVLHVPVGVEPMVDGTKLGGGKATLVVDGYVSIYVLDAGPDQVALIDCGNDEHGAAILSALEARGLGAGSVKAIFLSHGHGDHIAGCRLFPHAEIYAFPGDVKIASGEERAHGPLPSLFDIAGGKSATVTRTLTDEETISVGRLQVKAYAVPGHTPGSAAYLSSGVLYLGDSATGRSNRKSLKHADWFYSYDVAQNVAELRNLYARLKAEKAVVTTLAFAHAGPLPGVELLLTAGD